MKFKAKALTAVMAGCMAMAVSMQASAAGVTFFTSQAAFNGASSSTLVETFERASIPGVGRNVSLSGFSANGITYAPVAGPNVFIADPGYNNFGTGVGTTTTSVLTGNGDEDFSFSFAPRTAVGFDIYTNGLGPVTVSVLGAGNALLDSFLIPGSQNGIGYLGIVSTSAISAIRWDSTLGGQLNTGVDNISLGDAITVVPVPPAMALLLGGLALLGAAGRRGRTRH